MCGKKHSAAVGMFFRFSCYLPNSQEFLRIAGYPGCKIGLKVLRLSLSLVLSATLFKPFGLNVSVCDYGLWA
jgi:hypothetical protein